MNKKLLRNCRNVGVSPHDAVQDSKSRVIRQSKVIDHHSEDGQ
jgi:hypothetical protein